MTDPEVLVVDNPVARQYEAYVGDERVGIALYEIRPDLVVFTHMEVDPPWEGIGVGAKLAAGALDDARAKGLRVVPRCRFIASFIRSHPGYADLLDARG
jgi:hypothetical protein